MHKSFYNILQDLPLFKGMGFVELNEVIDKVQFHFIKKKPGEIIVKQNDLCENLTFVISGSYKSERIARDASYKLEENNLKSPTSIEPENLFGMRTFYTRSYYALTNVSLVLLSKQTIRTLMKFNIFRINYINLLSFKTQISLWIGWNKIEMDLEKRFINFINSRYSYPAEEKILTIKMNQLAEELLCTRLNVSKMLRKLEQKDLLQLSRGKITIPHAEKLIQYKNSLE